MSTSNQPNSDIATNGWLSRIPDWLKPYFVLARLDRPIGWWLLLLPGWWAILIHHKSSFETVRLMGLFLIGAIIMRAAGCVINDLWDRDIDKMVARTALRPLAAGTLSVPSAFFFLGLILLAALLILLQLPFKAWIMGTLSIPLVICYPLAKRFTGWPQIVLGFVFSWGVLLGTVSVTNDWPSEAMFWVYIGTVCWVIGYDTIYAIQDKDEDEKLDVGSAAISLGSYLPLGVIIVYGTAILFWSFGFWLKFDINLWLIGIGGAALHLIWQIRKLLKIDRSTALILFKSNRDCGLILTAGLILQIVF